MSEKKELSIIDKVELIKKEAKTKILSDTIKSEKKLKDLVDQYSGIDIIDKASYDFAVKGSKEMKKIRGIVDKKRLEITKPFNDFKSDMISYVKPWTETLSTAETKINEKITDFENIEKAKAQKLFAERCQLLAQNGFTMVSGNYQCGAVFLSPEQIEGFDVETFNFHIEIGKKELKRQEIEKDRKDEEAAEIAKEREAIAKEREDIAKERAEIAKDRASVDAEIAKLNPVVVEPTIEKTAEKINEVITPVEKIDKTANSVKKLNEAVENQHPVSDPEKTHNPQQNTKNLMKLGREAGFNNFRKQFIDLMESDKKFTRPTLVEWAEKLELC